ncbi:MAG: 6-phosphogluconolactonase, partial [Bacteroidetes bacterium]|nr:6-phosphogluconolactonase [Bacteroidota bacterium]MDA1121809.1 6-phosphogluconolactonase [Bacteroidota bacterium]
QRFELFPLFYPFFEIRLSDSCDLIRGIKPNYMETFIYKTTEETVINFAKHFAREADGRDQFNVALSGGQTPKLFFEILCSDFKEVINWENVQFFWGDERCVPPDHSESNFGSAKDRLFKPINTNWNIHRIKGENDPEEEAIRYSNEIVEYVPIVNGLPRFDFIILGLGEDGHTASIFPDQMRLLTSDLICAVASHPESGQKRITLTGKVINNASIVAFLTPGKGKAERISEILNEREISRQYPGAAINPEEGQLYWYLDEASARLLN